MPKDLQYFKRLRKSYERLGDESGMKAMDEVIARFSIKKKDRQTILRSYKR